MTQHRALAILALLGAAACSKPKPVEQPVPVATTTPPPPAAQPAPKPVAQPAPTDDGGAAKRLAEMQATIDEPVYFEYDKDRLMPEAKDQLERKYQVLAKNMSVRIRVEGHADDRGSDEYNLALGQRRAEMAKNYLVQRGIDASRVATVSYGEERPAMNGASEMAWSKNRRDNFTIVSGQITVGQNQQD